MLEKSVCDQQVLQKRLYETFSQSVKVNRTNLVNLSFSCSWLKNLPSAFETGDIMFDS